MPLSHILCRGSNSLICEYKKCANRSNEGAGSTRIYLMPLSNALVYCPCLMPLSILVYPDSLMPVVSHIYLIPYTRIRVYPYILIFIRWYPVILLPSDLPNLLTSSYVPYTRDTLIPSYLSRLAMLKETTQQLKEAASNSAPISARPEYIRV